MHKEILGVLCSGRGTDLQSIIDAIGRGEVSAEIAIVLTDKPDAYALTRAEKAGIKAVCIDRKKFDGRQPFEEALVKALDEAGVTLVVLAGFMRILTPYFVRHFAGRIMNIHPALLPSFPGAHAHRDVLAYGVKVSGCTVHFSMKARTAAQSFCRPPCLCSMTTRRRRSVPACSNRSTSSTRRPSSFTAKGSLRSTAVMSVSVNNRE